MFKSATSETKANDYWLILASSSSKLSPKVQHDIPYAGDSTSCLISLFNRVDFCISR